MGEAWTTGSCPETMTVMDNHVGGREGRSPARIRPWIAAVATCAISSAAVVLLLFGARDAVGYVLLVVILLLGVSLVNGFVLVAYYRRQDTSRRPDGQ